MQSPPVPPGTGVVPTPGSWGTSTPCPTKWLLYDMDLHQDKLPFPESFVRDDSIASSLASQSPLDSVVPAAFYSQDLTGGEIKKMAFNTKNASDFLSVGSKSLRWSDS